MPVHLVYIVLLSMQVVFSKRCLEYELPAHPESPQRLCSSYEYLKEKNLSFIEPSPATEKELLLVHTKDLIERIRNLDFFDQDSPALAGIFDYACLSAGAAIMAMKLSLKGESTFSMFRPPGHHAGKNFLGGFCYFNNLAVAGQKAMSLGRRLAILDIDCHHGNGTQDIFLGKEDVLYVSLHQVPLYPGSGLKSEKNCLNYPLRAETGEEEYLAILKDAFFKIKSFCPHLLAISIGFDTYKNDPLTQMGLEIESYGKIKALIVESDIPYFCVLEGGYSPELKFCIYEFIKS